MLIWVLALVIFQSVLERRMLEEEDARVENPAVLLEAVKNSDPQIQRKAARALGRFERPEYAGAIRPLLDSPDPAVRMEAINALAQIKAAIDFRPLLDIEKDGGVRGVLYESIGRLGGPEEVLVEGLKDSELPARTGAAKGLDTLFRLNSSTMKPSPAAIAVLRETIRGNTFAPLRELALLTLNAAGDSDPATLALALDDPEPQVRRLAVIGSKQWKDDASPIVRYEALRIAGNCDRATAAIGDPGQHVALLAIDQLGNKCPGRPLERIVDNDKDWRRQSRALVSLAKVDAGAARRRLPRFVDHERWEVRVYAAAAAKILKDSATLSRLLRDNHANVIAAALSTPRDAVRALDNEHYGLVYEAALLMKGWEDGRLAVPALLAAFDRISRERKDTSRDVRLEILQRLREFGDVRVAGELRRFLSDFDPAVAKLVAEIVSEKTGNRETPGRTRPEASPLPADTHEYIRALGGATAHIKMKEAGSFTMRLFSEETPVTAAVFARLAENGYYNGLTIHRIVPNFIVQGGSPGANEYVGIADFMRDELGLASNVRGTVGLSTRGRDTGDAQFYINLVDNFRLDHNYTVFGRITDGIDNIDRIQEGDVIESIEIRRQVQPR
jgi:cyclophilin family peptidyl-prolyl cis-trans isomerase/HEAT repeat protein